VTVLYSDRVLTNQERWPTLLSSCILRTWRQVPGMFATTFLCWSGRAPILRNFSKGPANQSAKTPVKVWPSAHSTGTYCWNQSSKFTLVAIPCSEDGMGSCFSPPNLNRHMPLHPCSALPRLPSDPIWRSRLFVSLASIRDYPQAGAAPVSCLLVLGLAAWPRPCSAEDCTVRVSEKCQKRIAEGEPSARHDAASGQ
jgi:hypothetical protein